MLGSELGEILQIEIIYFFIEKVHGKQTNCNIKTFFLMIPPISLSGHVPTCIFRRRNSFSKEVHNVCLKSYYKIRNNLIKY